VNHAKNKRIKSNDQGRGKLNVLDMAERNVKKININNRQFAIKLCIVLIFS
jgi:hypothetical protein